MHETVADPALLALLAALDKRGHRFVTPTPDTHGRVLRQPGREQARSLADVFGWSLPFAPDLLDAELMQLMRAADVLEERADGRMAGRVRASTLHGRLFLHSAYPTEAEDAVFLGPDSYRFADFIVAEQPPGEAPLQVVDIGAGAGVGAIVAALRLPRARVSALDLNPAALRMARANAANAGARVEAVESDGLAAAPAELDLVLANPPFICGRTGRTYRDGGEMHGGRVSLDWALAAAPRLAPGGRMLLYTGSAVVDGAHALRAALDAELPALGCTLRWREIDPDIFGEELARPEYAGVDRIAAVGAVIARPLPD